MVADAKRIFSSLSKSFGPRGWWPVNASYASRPRFPEKNAEIFEVIAGAILTQNTSWKNVEKALANLRAANRLSARAITSCPLSELRELVKPSGYYNQKAVYLKGVARRLKDRGLKKFFSRPLPELKKELISWKGVGPETRDSILLYAAGKPVFVVDAFTQRLARRYPLPGESYAQLQEFFESSLSSDAELFNEFHALIVELAKRNCFKKDPGCANCPLKRSCKKLIS